MPIATRLFILLLCDIETVLAMARFANPFWKFQVNKIPPRLIGGFPRSRSLKEYSVEELVALVKRMVVRNRSYLRRAETHRKAAGTYLAPALVHPLHLVPRSRNGAQEEFELYIGLAFIECARVATLIVETIPRPRDYKEHDEGGLSQEQK
ncbi:hypothetical protein K438DRAFT_1980878 [Mycena galopus ATCC 62051]|nr:hypothetical protein K438DRAFT_1980878 [Mycena galopus ATCC 62051]